MIAPVITLLQSDRGEKMGIDIRNLAKGAYDKLAEGDEGIFVVPMLAGFGFVVLYQIQFMMWNQYRDLPEWIVNIGTFCLWAGVVCLALAFFLMIASAIAMFAKIITCKLRLQLNKWACRKS